MITLIKNYKYDNKYDYIKLFSNKSEQDKYFNSLDSIDIHDNNYIRENESFIIEKNLDYLKSNGVNYVIYDNGYKEMFCFIVSKEYVDEYNTRIHFEVDVLNTFLFDITLQNSFVERKVCSIEEISNFDEGIDIGEHVITQEMCSMEKLYSWFAMFNGIKQQQLTFENGNLTGVSVLPSSTMKPLTIIDGIQYPIHFMELKNSYEEPTFIDIPTGGIGGSGGNWREGILSSQGFRFIKGFEGFAPNKYQDSEGYWTIAYGVTLHGEPDIYNDLVNKQPVTESEGAQISYRLKNENYGAKIKNHLIIGGIKEQYQFDALLSLSYNCGVGTITGSGYDTKVWDAIKLDPTNESYIRPIWESFKTNGGLAGLVARRKEECNMFFNKSYQVRPIGLINSGGSVSGNVTENDGNGWLPI